MTTAMSPPPLEQTQDMIEYYAAFQEFLSVGNASEEAQKRRVQINRAQQKLLKLYQSQFYELATDVYDELQRRIKHLPGDEGFLPPNERLHAKRNQARKKLSLLSPTRFNDLAFDILFEIERRTPEVRNNDVAPEQNEKQYHEPTPSSQPPPYAPHGKPTPPVKHDLPPNLPPQQYGYSQDPSNQAQTPNAHPQIVHIPPTRSAFTHDQEHSQLPDGSNGVGNHTSSSTNSTYFSDMQSGHGHEGSDVSSPRSPSQFGPSYEGQHKQEPYGSLSNDARRQAPPPISIPDSNGSLYLPDNLSPLKSPNGTHLQTSVVTPTKSTLVEDDESSEMSDDASFASQTQTDYDNSWSQQANSTIGSITQDKKFVISPTGPDSQMRSNINDDTTEPSTNNSILKDDTIESISPTANTLHITPPTRSLSRSEVSKDLDVASTSTAQPGITPAAMEEYQATLNDKDEQIQLLVEEGTRMDENITKLEAQLAESEALKETLVEENGRLHQMIGESELAKDNALTELQRLKTDFGTQSEKYINELESKQRELANLTILHQDLSTKHKDLSAIHEDKQEELKHLTSQHQELSTKHRELSSAHDDQLNKLEALSAQHQELNTKHRDLNTEHETGFRDLNSQVLVLQQSLANHEKVSMTMP